MTNIKEDRKLRVNSEKEVHPGLMQSMQRDKGEVIRRNWRRTGVEGDCNSQQQQQKKKKTYLLGRRTILKMAMEGSGWTKRE